MASSFSNISTASNDSDERKNRLSKKTSSSSSASRRTIISECNVNVTPELGDMDEENDVIIYIYRFFFQLVFVTLTKQLLN